MTSFLLRLKRFCGYLFGLVYFLSGLLKLMDPVGAGLVMKEYFDFLLIGFMAPTAKFFGVTFALAETIVGAALVTGVWRRLFGLIAVIMQSVFTVVTTLLLIFNPEMDCGCFGEAIHLTHLQTFTKNLILLALILLFYIPRKHLGEPKTRKYVSFGIVSLSVIGFMIHSLISIPPVDYTAYKPGAELLAATVNGGDEIYEAVFTYEKDGITQNFTLKNLPDSSWTFISTETRMKASIKDSTIELSMYDPQSQSYADTLAIKGKVMVISVYNPDIRAKKWKKIEKVAKTSMENGIRTYILTTDYEPVPEGLKNIAYTCDYKTLVSLNRSNGGATYFYNGTLIKKWSRRTLPSAEELKKSTTDDPTEAAIDYQSKGSLGFQGFLLYVFAVLLLL